MNYQDTLDDRNVLLHYYELSQDQSFVAKFNTFTDQASFGFDMHYELEVGIVRSGKMTRKSRSHEETLGAGQVWLNGIWEPHGFQLAEVPCSVAALMISPEFILNMEQMGFNWMLLFSVPPERRPQISEKNRLKVLEICDKLQEMEADDRHTRELWRRNLLLQLLIVLVEDASELRLEDVQEEMKRYSGIQPAIQKVFRTKRFISLDEAAKACSLSESHFSKVFRSLMGIPFSKFALRFRIKEAARQLITTDDSLKSIALEWGFTDISHLHTCFKSHFSISPIEYRKMYGKAESVAFVP